jgi:hypothetical protein
VLHSSKLSTEVTYKEVLQSQENFISNMTKQIARPRFLLSRKVTTERLNSNYQTENLIFSDLLLRYKSLINYKLVLVSTALNSTSCYLITLYCSTGSLQKVLTFGVEVFCVALAEDIICFLFTKLLDYKPLVNTSFDSLQLKVRNIVSRPGCQITYDSS